MFDVGNGVPTVEFPKILPVVLRGWNFASIGFPTPETRIRCQNSICVGGWYRMRYYITKPPHAFRPKNSVFLRNWGRKFQICAWFVQYSSSFGDICILPPSEKCTRSTRTSWSLYTLVKICVLNFNWCKIKTKLQNTLKTLITFIIV